MKSPYLDSFEFNKNITDVKLFKVLVIPAKFHTGYVAHFISDFVTGLLNAGWYVVDSDTAINREDIQRDIFEATGINKIPDILAFYIMRKEIFLKWKSIKQLKCLKILITEDVHRKYDVTPLNDALKWIHAVFVRYPNYTSSRIIKEKKWYNFHTNYRKNKIYFFNLYHAATEEYINPICFKNKENMVLLSGSLNLPYYEIRAKAKELMGVSDKIKWRVHPGYKNVIDSKKEAIDYAMEMSKHKLAIADQGTMVDSEHAYIIAKHFEIPAAGTALLTNKKMVPYIKHLGFKENENFIAATPETLLCITSAKSELIITLI
jgi:hypothetical protein